MNIKPLSNDWFLKRAMSCENKIVNLFRSALEKSGLDPSRVCGISDFLYQPEIVGSLGVNTFHVNRGRAIAFGTGMKLGNPELKVVTFIGDLITLGGNHFMHAARRNMDLVVVCINNFVYPKIAGKNVPKVKVSFSPYATFERPVNVPHVARSCGAVYVARWTALHDSELTQSMTKALQKSGFSAIEVMSPGTSYFAGISDSEEASQALQFYHAHSVIRNGEDTRNVEIDPQKEIVAGEFFEQERPTFIESYNAQLTKVLGDKFTPYGAKGKT